MWIKWLRPLALIRTVLAVAAGLAVLLPSIAFGNCFPNTIDRPSGVIVAPRTDQAQPARRKIGLFIDASASMRGFVRESAAGVPTPIASLYSELPEIAKDITPAIETFRVGTSVDPIPPAMFNLSWRAVFYCQSLNARSLRGEELDYNNTRCLNQPGGKPNGFQMAGRIDQAVDHISRNADYNLAIVATDLFASSRDLDDAFGANFRRAVGDILAGGRSVMLLGVEMPYKGIIFDLPSYGADKGPNHDGTHPLFLLMFGDKALLEKTRDRLRDVTRPFNLAVESVLFHVPSLTGLVASGRARGTALTAAIPRGVSDPRVLESVRPLRQAMEEWPETDRFPQMSVVRSTRPNWRSTSITFTLPPELAALGGMGTLELLAGRTYTWNDNEAKACPDRWDVIRSPALEASSPLLRRSESGDNPLKSVWSFMPDKAAQAEIEARTTKGFGSTGMQLHRVSMLWQPDRGALGQATVAVPKWVERFGFLPAQETTILRTTFGALPANKNLQFPTGPASLPATGGFFPALNLQEIVMTLQRVQRDKLQSLPTVELGTFVAVWRWY